MKEYQVGQILFFIADSNKVIPIQIIEEVIRTTLQGKDKTYIAKLPDKKQTTIDIKKLTGHLFATNEDAKAFMMKNANDAITQMIEEAEGVASSLFGHVKQPVLEIIEEPDIITPDIIEEKVQQEKENDIIKVDLGNGKFGKMSVGDLNRAGAAQ